MSGPKQNWATEVSVERNKIPILCALDPYLSKSKSCLEIASGWGDHVRSWAEAFPSCAFQPTEEDADMLRRLQTTIAGVSNVRPPTRLDVLDDEQWKPLEHSKPFDLMLANNLFHVAPWEVCEAVFQHADAFLHQDGIFAHYGAILIDGDFQSTGNQKFDADLKSRDKRYGLRELSDIMALAAQNNLYLRDRLAMPSGNWFCFYGRQTTDNSIRIAKATDVAAIQAMVESAYSKYVERMGKRPAPMQADYEALIKQAQMHVICRSGIAQGALALRLEDDVLLLDNVVVDPASQGHGLGGKLIAFAEERARYLKASEIRLYTNTKMHENLALYTKLGFVETDRRTEDGFDRVFFAKKVQQT